MSICVMAKLVVVTDNQLKLVKLNKLYLFIPQQILNSFCHRSTAVICKIDGRLDVSVCAQVRMFSVTAWRGLCTVDYSVLLLSSIRSFTLTFLP